MTHLRAARCRFLLLALALLAACRSAPDTAAPTRRSPPAPPSPAPSDEPAVAPTEVERLPDFRQHADSPDAGDRGVALALPDGPSVAVGRPVVLRGHYRVGQTVRRDADCLVLGHTVIEVDHVDGSGDWRGIVEDVSDQPPCPPDPGERDDPSLREGGWFNLDLAARCPLLAQPGRYTVRAILGPHTSAPLTLTVVPSSATTGPPTTRPAGR